MVQLGMLQVRTGLLALLALLLAGLVPVPVLGANAPGGGPGSAPLMAQAAGLTVRVVRVIDGDTIEVCCLEGGRERVRYIGINAPEPRHPTRGEEPGGREAAALNRELVGGRTVRLERDVQERDRYGRLLAYVWMERAGAEVMVNAALVRLGYAQVMTVPPNVRYAELLLKLQREAREAGRGLWATGSLGRDPAGRSRR